MRSLILGYQINRPVLCRRYIYRLTDIHIDISIYIDIYIYSLFCFF